MDQTLNKLGKQKTNRKQNLANRYFFIQINEEKIKGNNKIIKTIKRAIHKRNKHNNIYQDLCLRISELKNSILNYD